MSTLKQNKLTPVLGALALIVVVFILYRAFAGDNDKPVKAGPTMTSIPAPPAEGKNKGGKDKLPKTKPLADVDNAAETLKSVVASNKELQAQVMRLQDENRSVMRAIEERGRSAPERVAGVPLLTYGPPAAGAVAASPTATAPAASGAPPSTSASEVGSDADGAKAVKGGRPGASGHNAFEQALDAAGNAAESAFASFGSMASPKGQPRTAATSSEGSMDRAGDGARRQASSSSRSRGPNNKASSEFAGSEAIVGAGHLSYKPQPPMGYVTYEDKKTGNRGPTQVRYVRTLSTATDETIAGKPGTGEAGGQQGTTGTASQAAKNAEKLEATRYFTIPENATMVGARIMTTIIGRIPIDGRVTDPLPFKALIGRDNLAANGFELPPDVVGTIISGVAIGDMALSCSEARVRSLTFVFNDGAIRTVSAKGRGGASGGGGGGGAGGGDLGYLSDEHGNPCIPGTFVTNAPRYLADVVGFGALNAYGQSLAEAQTSVTSSGLGTTTTVVDANKYALGRAAGSATGEVSAWIMSRLKNSFDAVVTPVPHDPKLTFTVNFEQEVALDKPDDARKLVHRRQQNVPQRGARYGLE